MLFSEKSLQEIKITSEEMPENKKPPFAFLSLSLD